MDEQQPSIIGIIGNFFDLSKGRVSYKTLHKRVADNASIDGIHMCQLIAAMIICSIGLNLDSTEAIIGAMLICPLMGSVIAIGYGVATINRMTIREAFAGLAVQSVLCFLTSTLYFVISPLSTTTSQLLSNSSATIWDVIIAFVGGFAGAIGLSRRMEPSTLIAGVAVATALMPPLCSVGYGLALQDYGIAASAFYEFLVNVVFIAFGSAIVFSLLRVPLVTDLDGDGLVTEEEMAEAEQLSRRIRARVVVGLVIFAIPCFFYSVRTVHLAMADYGTIFEVVDAYDTEMVTRELEVVCPSVSEYRVGIEDSYDMATETLSQTTVATVETTTELTPTAKSEVEAIIRLHVNGLESVNFVVVKEDSATGSPTSTESMSAPVPSASSTPAASASSAA